MRTISLQIDERVYPQITSFLRLLPEEYCQIFEDDDSGLSKKERSVIETIQARIGKSTEPSNPAPRKYREPPPELVGKMRLLCDERALLEPVWDIPESPRRAQ